MRRSLLLLSVSIWYLSIGLMLLDKTGEHSGPAAPPHATRELGAVAQSAKGFVDRLYSTDGKYGYLSEYLLDGVPSRRYTVRHGAALGRWLYAAWGDDTRSERLFRLRRDYGFALDIYDPLFGQSSSAPDDFMFSAAAYHDIAARPALPEDAGRRAYTSRVGALGAAGFRLYVEISRTDPLLRSLQAVHLLNKGDVSVAMERLRGVSWDSYGVKYPSSSRVYSSVRTGAFLVAATLLGYQHDVAEYRAAADALYSFLVSDVSPQIVGGRVLLPGLKVMPEYNGAFYSLWALSPGGDVVDVGVGGWEAAVVGMLLGARRLESDVPSNQESTIVLLQAVRVYSHYARGLDYPTGELLPGGVSADRGELVGRGG